MVKIQKIMQAGRQMVGSQSSTVDGAYRVETEREGGRREGIRMGFIRAVFSVLN